MQLLISIFVILQSVCVMGHGSMVMPITWFDRKGVYGMKTKAQCNAGCEENTTQSYCSCMWFTNETFNQGGPTIDDSFRTYFPSLPSSPWRAPGTAPIFSPCGIAGGNPHGCGPDAGIDCPGGGFGYGPDALDYDFKDVITTNWKVGEVVEAAWGIQANHGGGYAYRLCKFSEEGRKGLTEECFNQGHLEFVGETQWVQYGEDKKNRTEFKAFRTKNGTFPKDSQWTRNPIPACGSPGGGANDPFKKCLNGTQFPPPAPGLEGFGEHPPHWTTEFGFNIVDQLQVPSYLSPGQYVLSFRWDCEQTPQVWNSCANINIIA